MGQDILHAYHYICIENISQLAIKLFFPLFFTSQKKDKKNGFALDSAAIAKPNFIGYVASQNQTEVKPVLPVHICTLWVQSGFPVGFRRCGFFSLVSLLGVEQLSNLSTYPNLVLSDILFHLPLCKQKASKTGEHK